jgi:hypothetical protein
MSIRRSKILLITRRIRLYVAASGIPEMFDHMDNVAQINMDTEKGVSRTWPRVPLFTRCASAEPDSAVPLAFRFTTR